MALLAGERESSEACGGADCGHQGRGRGSSRLCGAARRLRALWALVGEGQAIRTAIAAGKSIASIHTSTFLACFLAKGETAVHPEMHVCMLLSTIIQNPVQGVALPRHSHPTLCFASRLS